MTDFIKRFWAWAVSLAGIVGLYLAADAIHLVSVFWAVIAASIILGGGPKLAKRGLDYANRVRNYPSLLRRVAEAEAAEHTLRNELETIIRQNDERWNAGVTEGRAQILGSILSFQVDPPRIIAIGSSNGALALVARYKDESKYPPESTRFSVVGVGIGDIKGVVEVVRIDKGQQLAHLKCVDPSVPQFWQHLSERAEYDSSPPPNVELAQYVPQAISKGNGTDIEAVVGSEPEEVGK